MAEHVNGPFCMIGPYMGKSIQAELEPLDDVEDVFGQAAANLRKRRGPPTGRWHLDEMVVKIGGRRMYLWRAVDPASNRFAADLHAPLRQQFLDVADA